MVQVQKRAGKEVIIISDRDIVNDVCEEIVNFAVKMAEQSENIYFDFSTASYIDSSCLGKILAMTQELQDKATCVVDRITKDLYDKFSYLGLLDKFEIKEIIDAQ